VTVASNSGKWVPGAAPVAVVMLSLNEAHNMREVLENLKGFAQEVILVDSYSNDETVSIALSYGIQIVQRKFRGFGDQWNFAIHEIPVRSPWIMKMDPDERLTDELKKSLIDLIKSGNFDGLSVSIRLNFIGKPLPVYINLLRAWRKGRAVMSDVLVNEHIKLDGVVSHARGFLEHKDSPNLEHWFNKQNRYSTMEAISQFQGDALSVNPRLIGNALERRMWLKRHFWRIPFRYSLLFLYNYLVLGAWRAGRVGIIWCRLRSDVMGLCEYKVREMRITGVVPVKCEFGPGHPDLRVEQCD
jgi:glycosyltransferase involved in cell wall biosynthesis